MNHTPWLLEAIEHNLVEFLDSQYRRIMLWVILPHNNIIFWIVRFSQPISLLNQTKDPVIKSLGPNVLHNFFKGYHHDIFHRILFRQPIKIETIHQRKLLWHNNMTIVAVEDNYLYQVNLTLWRQRQWQLHAVVRCFGQVWN